MKKKTRDQQDAGHTLEHLLGVVVVNREKRCAEVRENAAGEVRSIIHQAYQRSRARMNRHIAALREQYRLRASAALARNQTRMRQQQQKRDREVLDTAWPKLRESMLALWEDPESRRAWLDAAVASAKDTLLEHDWHIEHPVVFDTEEHKWLKHAATVGKQKGYKLTAAEDIEAGIRISARGTVIDTTLDGLLKQRLLIGAELLARIKQGADGDD
jgi:hypothetical protein